MDVPSKRLLRLHNFTLRQLQYAVAVSETLSFRAAAKLLNVSQPSLSAQLKELEEGLGVRLFERDRRGVMLTAQGAPLIKRAQATLREAMDLEEDAQRQKDPLSGTLTFGVIPTISPYLLPAITPALRTRCKKLAVRWVEDKTENLILQLEAGALDAALLALEADLGLVDHATVFIDPFVLCTPKGHRLAKGKGAMALDELAGNELLLLEEGHCFRSQTLEICSASDVTEHEFRATSLSTLVQMVGAGAGVTLLPTIAVAVETARAEVATRNLKDARARRTLVLAFRKRSSIAEALRTVAEVMSTAAREAFGAQAARRASR